MNNCWLVGAGYMAQEYIKVLKDKAVNLTVIGRGKDRVDVLKSKFKINAISGGLFAFLETKPDLPKFVIVAVSCEELYLSTIQLIEVGIKNILVEKPAGMTLEEISHLAKNAEEKKLNLYVAYNRRFYHSVDLLKKLIEEEGGIQSVQFEFTEWVHAIDIQKFPPPVLSRFIIANSSHVIDTVFFLAGKPNEFNFFVGGNDVDWHPSGSIFTGTGITEKGIYFSYTSNWGAPGRWAIEFLTSKSRYYLKPMERLARQEKGSIAVNEVESNYQIDIDYKPGLFNMLTAFFEEKSNLGLCHIREHELNFRYYELIGNYQ
jgi:predicted dehydrogenase